MTRGPSDPSNSSSMKHLLSLTPQKRHRATKAEAEGETDAEAETRTHNRPVEHSMKHDDTWASR